MKQENIAEVFNLWFSNKMDSVHTILPGQIVTYDGHTTRKAEVKPMVKLRTVHNDIIEISPIKNVPVMFPSTKNFNMLFPLKKGDGCLLVFSESSIGNFLLNATDNAKDADDLNRFDLSDCICIPGLWSFTNSPDVATLNSTDFFIQFQDSKIQIKDTTNEIIIEDKLGNTIETLSTGVKITDAGNNTIETVGTTVDINGNTKKFVTYTELNTAISVFLALLNAHTHSGVTAGAGTSGSPSSPMTFDISAAESQKARTG